MFSSDPTENTIEFYHVNIMKDGQLEKPRFTMTSTTCPDYWSLMRTTETIECIQYVYLNSFSHNADRGLEGGRRVGSTIIVSSNGLIQIKNELDWKSTIAAVTRQSYFEGNVIVIVEMDDREAKYMEKDVFFSSKKSLRGDAERVVVLQYRMSSDFDTLGECVAFSLYV
jgi:hypothetical protein